MELLKETLTAALILRSRKINAESNPPLLPAMSAK